MNFCAPFIPNDPTINFHRYFQASLLALYTLAYGLLHFYYKFWGPTPPVEEESAKRNLPITQQHRTRRRASLNRSIVLSRLPKSRRECR
jgi:hypothetical protein